MRTPRSIVLNKKRGETPLEALQAWKTSHSKFEHLPATYAGRLDPMAEGKLLILLGEECKKKDLYIGLDKEYEVTVLFDIATDTGDTLGIPEYQGIESKITSKGLRRKLEKLIGAHEVPYPAYSSKTVGGKPLFQHTLAGTLSEIEIPTHLETIYTIKVTALETLTATALRERILAGLALVPTSDEESKALGADFRQEVIRAGWRALFTILPERTFISVSLKVTCGSGTYMRTLAERLAREFDTTGLALAIKRTKIGRYKRFGWLGIWTKKY
jgi:tRNA pseudouridine(55) synthase